MSTYIGNNEISGIYVGNEEITSIYVGTDLVYSSGGGGVNYLCFTSKYNGSTVALSTHGTPSAITLEYSLDKTNWNTWDLSATTLNSGDTMYLRGDNNSFSTSSSNYYKFVMSGLISASGSIMTLLDSTDTLRTLQGNTFRNLFEDCTALRNARELELPATTIGDNEYDCMFRRCSYLEEAPTVLPATLVGNYSYSGMFLSCSNITTAPTIMATDLGTYSCNEMFNNCSNLNSVTTYILRYNNWNSLRNWLKNVSATGTFYNYGGVTYPSGVDGIPSGWTEVTQ